MMFLTMQSHWVILFSNSYQVFSTNSFPITCLGIKRPYNCISNSSINGFNKNFDYKFPKLIVNQSKHWWSINTYTFRKRKIVFSHSEKHDQIWSKFEEPTLIPIASFKGWVQQGVSWTKNDSHKFYNEKLINSLNNKVWFTISNGNN